MSSTDDPTDDLSEPPSDDGRVHIDVDPDDFEERDAGDRRSYYLEIFLVSMAGLLIEISYTRIISYKLFYYWVYLVIGLALLGIGSGSVFVAISKRLRHSATRAVMMWGSLAGALSVGIGYVVLARTPIDTLRIWDYGTGSSLKNLAALVVISLSVYGSFVAIGIMIATLFGRRSDRIGRLYFADLAGAALACLVVVYLVATIGPPSVVCLAGVLLALVGLRQAWRASTPALVAGAVFLVALAAGVVAPSLLPTLQLDAVKENVAGKENVVSEWSPVFRVDAVQVSEETKLLYHDGTPGSAIYRWDGDTASLGRFDTDPRLLPFAVVGDPPEDVMIIGAAGGNEVLASLYFDAGHIDAIELNPVTYDLTANRFADYAGHLADDPRVNYVNGDGRSFLARSDDTYDIVWFPAPDSYAATNAASSGAFVLSESYLYTREAIEDSLDHLGGDGVLAAQFGEFDFENQPNRTARYVATAREALASQGVDDPTDHIMVATTPAVGFGQQLSTILVKEEPFTDEEIDAFTTGLDDIEGSRLRYAPGQPVAGEPVSDLVTAQGDELDRFFDDYPNDVHSISDDGPFFWHFTSFDTVLGDMVHPVDPGDLELFEVGIGERVLLLLLVVATLFAAVFLLLPFVAIRGIFTRLPRKGRSVIYFASLGFGFIFIEITLIQKLTLFLGYPTYSLTVTLASILLFTGVGALLSGRWAGQVQRAIPVLGVAIVALTLFYAFALAPLTDALLTTPLLARVAVAFLVLAPLGLCLGMFMPLGLGAVAALTDHPSEYVAWGWAVNGFASVVGSVLTTMLAMAFGFQTVLFVALAIYLVALVALRSLAGPGRAATAVAS
ncbi:MAG: hypothetical protein KDB10_14490 [Acidimicrobiales bacterium]|nr:hypothetical protein [Acidimicrobiales bacterium]MCB9372939.1 hypothetical protein [Microthrixaceae bacterium]